MITFSVLGGGGEVGANCFLLGVNGDNILLDCGTHPKKEGIEALPELSLLPRAPKAVVISHGHVDHCGCLPYLIKQFPETRVYATPPTGRIMDRMLHNSVAVMQTIARERAVEGYPLYNHEDVTFALRGMDCFDFRAPFELDLDVPVEVSLHDAGHVLGSSSILLRLPGHTLFYTGDICEAGQELMAGYSPLDEDEHVDTLIVECTHGATDDPRDGAYHGEGVRLAEAISAVLRGGGAVLVPSFALGRTQELLNIIARQQEEGRIPDVPVYASGLGRAVYEIYDRFGDYLRGDAILRPLSMFGRIGNVWEPGAVDHLIGKPGIIVATSGMMLENTPSAMIAQTMVRYNHHGIFFVGYLDSDTLGHRLLNSGPGALHQFQRGGPAVEVKLENIKRFFFSAHADRMALRTLVDRIRPKTVIYVHGDSDAIDWMQHHTGNGCQAHTPMTGQTITISE